MTTPVDDARPDGLPAPLAVLGVPVGVDSGPPPPSRTPHEILLREAEHLSRTVRALVRVLARRGLLTALEVAVERDAIAAEDATDAAVGLVRRLLEPLAATLARSEARFPCGCTHAARTAEEAHR